MDKKLEKELDLYFTKTNLTETVKRYKDKAIFDGMRAVCFDKPEDYKIFVIGIIFNNVMNITQTYFAPNSIPVDQWKEVMKRLNDFINSK